MKKTEVQITLTKDQYRTLVEMVNCGEWMINATRVNRIKKYEKLEQYIYSFTKQAGLEDCIDYDDEFKMYFPLKDFEETTLLPLRDEYDQETFWDELIDQLGSRDLIKQYGVDGYAKLTNEERFAARGRVEEKYGEEFEENGVENLVLAPRETVPVRE
ncbi:MAG: hypothetical protein ACHQ51_09525 [Elusimicrobiota bacterium]